MEVTEKTVRFEISIWREGNNLICIAASDEEVNDLVPEFIAKVNDSKGSERCHKKLFEKLDTLLDELGL